MSDRERILYDIYTILDNISYYANYDDVGDSDEYEFYMSTYEQIEDQLDELYDSLQDLKSVSESRHRKSYNRVTESEELARKLFVSLNKDQTGPFHTTRYFVLNDGYFVKEIDADSDDMAISKFNKMLAHHDNN